MRRISYTNLHNVKSITLGKIDYFGPDGHETKGSPFYRRSILVETELGVFDLTLMADKAEDLSV
jgi:hypothetical protein